MYDDTNDDSKVDSVHLKVFAIEESDADSIDYSTGGEIMYCVKHDDEPVDKDKDVGEVFVMVDKGEAIGCADDEKSYTDAHNKFSLFVNYSKMAQ